MVGWLRLMGCLIFFFMGVDGLIRLVEGFGGLAEANRLTGPAAAAAKQILWSVIGIGAGEIVMGLTLMAICLGIAAVIDRLERLPMPAHSIAPPAATIASHEPHPPAPKAGQADQPASAAKDRQKPSIGDGVVDPGPFRWPD
ncbi:hypothetical protein [Inquilinus sp. CA228]|uniref:hypothetical protein n=1 Tax=Inquilinus sp. CA228 TaxID=3455609 RepID=UPI003F8D105E